MEALILKERASRKEVWPEWCSGVSKEVELVTKLAMVGIRR
jgi:hypothetical protein